MQNNPIRANRRSYAVSVSFDPLMMLIRAFQAERDAINASDERDDSRFLRLLDRLIEDTPECWTAECAAEALRLVAEDMTENRGGFHEPVVARVLDFIRLRR